MPVTFLKMSSKGLDERAKQITPCVLIVNRGINIFLVMCVCCTCGSNQTVGLIFMNVCIHQVRKRFLWTQKSCSSLIMAKSLDSN